MLQLRGSVFAERERERLAFVGLGSVLDYKPLCYSSYYSSWLDITVDCSGVLTIEILGAYFYICTGRKDCSIHPTFWWCITSTGGEKRDLFLFGRFFWGRGGKFFFLGTWWERQGLLVRVVGRDESLLTTSRRLLVSRIGDTATDNPTEHGDRQNNARYALKH